MKGALVIFAAMVVIGIALYLSDVLYYRKRIPSDTDTMTPESDTSEEPTAAEQVSGNNPEGEVCCGMHTVCEKTNLSPVDSEIIYYDDEELDRYIGRGADEYTPAEEEEFRDVLMTLLPEDVAGWSRSIQLRKITLPTGIRDELLMIVRELRDN